MNKIVMNFKNLIALIILCLISSLSHSQSNKFKLDTLVENYLVKIVVYQNKLYAQNTKAFFAFYDTIKSRDPKFVYYFKYLPPIDENSGSYVPIFIDHVTDSNSNYIWQDIEYKTFDYEKTKKYVFEQIKNRNKIVIEDFYSIENELKEKAKNEFLRCYKGIIDKDYMTFVKSLHPASLDDTSYFNKAEYYKTINSNSSFCFTSVRIVKMDKLINFYGEIQILFYANCGYKNGTEKGEFKKTMIARSFDKGENWYFLEISNQDLESMLKQSKGEIKSPAISPELLFLLK